MLLARSAPSARRPPATTPAVDRLDPLADEDLQLALYCCYELHYGGLPGVDDRWEWNPWLLGVRAGLERAFEDALLDELGPPSGSARPEEMDLALRAIAESDEGPRCPPTSSARQPGRGARVPHPPLGLPAEGGRPALVGAAAAQRTAEGGPRGDPGRRVRRRRARADPRHDVRPGHGGAAARLDPGAYLDAIPGYTLATVNLMSLLGLHRRWRGAIVGHLALFEMTSSIPNRRYATGLRRLGFGERATAFFDEHVEADAVHENIAAVDLAGGLVRQQPDLGADVLWGARALAALDARWTDGVLRAWEAGESSLRAADARLAV